MAFFSSYITSKKLKILGKIFKVHHIFGHNIPARFF